MDHNKNQSPHDHKENHKHHDHEAHSHHDHNDHESHHGSHDHEGHDDHSNHGHGGHDHGDMVTEFRNKFFVILVITIPIMLLSPMIQYFVGVDWSFPGDIYIVAALSTFVYFYGGWPFI